MNTTDNTRPKPKLYVITVSTRPGRAGVPLSTWIFERATAHGSFDVELVDLKEENLPMFDEPRHPRLRQYEHEHTRRWSAKIDAADAFVFVTPEYDHGTPPSLINALIYLVQEWAHKPVGFVSYGGPAGGTRAVQMVKPMMVALKLVVLHESVMVPLFTHSIDDLGIFQPSQLQQTSAQAMLEALSQWVSVLAPMRS
ncbi:MAG TPA: NAD(P)H-dependent oxidoreductase [Polyangiaceae bacterium]|nr:NAD(P)H-dependent oxidoreductase [Polyangiaceae bacterium]